MLKIVLGTIAGAIAVLLAVVLFRFNRKRLHIIRAGKAADPKQLETIYSEIDRLGTEAPCCAVLARTNRSTGSESDWGIPVPAYVEGWANRVITADAGKDVSFQLALDPVSEPVLRGQIYRLVPVPRHLTKSGKARNRFSPDKYVVQNPRLLAALAAVCPAYPKELLSYLLAAGMETFEFDPMFQARVGGSPSWVQDAEFPIVMSAKSG